MIFFNSNYNLAIKIPETVLLKNIRKQERQKVDQEMVSLAYEHKDAVQESRFRAYLIDRSLGGFSFKSSLNNVFKSKAGQNIEFKFGGMETYSSAIIVDISMCINASEGTKFNRVCLKMKKALQ